MHDSAVPSPARSRPATRGAVWLLSTAMLAGCSSGPDFETRSMVERGEYARAAARLSDGLSTDRSDRDYMLDRMRLGITLLAEGRPKEAEPIMSRAFEILRTQGINDDKTVAAAVFGEGGVIFWKGEPFEQAMMFHYIAVQKAMLGEWDNARAAAQSSLFLLKDFGANERGGRKSTEDVAREAWRRAERSGDEGEYEAYLGGGYTPAPTNFALGYFMSGAANLALHRAGGDASRLAEARDNFTEAARLAGGLEAVSSALMEGGANTLFVVDFGPGPEKVRYGPDGSLATFAARLSSDARPLAVDAGNGSTSPWAIAADVNALAADHMWNNFEDVRSAKSSIGTALLIGGGVAATSDDSTARIVGLSLIGAGLLSKLTAGADLRHCELLPQRVYVAAARIDEARSPVTISIGGGARLVLPGLSPPTASRGLALYYVRWPMAGAAAQWASAGRIVYAADSYEGDVPGDDLPWILGGRCVRKPTLEVLQRYQRAGHLLDYSVNDLENLYRAEGINLRPDPRAALGLRHVLEGGDSLEAPVPGSAGFVRLFCREHAPYRPRSAEAIDLAARAGGASRRVPVPQLPLSERTLR